MLLLAPVLVVRPVRQFGLWHSFRTLAFAHIAPFVPLERDRYAFLEDFLSAETGRLFYPVFQIAVRRSRKRVSDGLSI